MPVDQWSNNAHSTLASGISDSDVLLSVQSGHGVRFDVPGDGYYATIADAAASSPMVSGEFEIVRVTDLNTDTFTITRAQQGTSARAFDSGDTFAQYLTAESLDKYELTLGFAPVVNSDDTFVPEWISGIFSSTRTVSSSAANSNDKILLMPMKIPKPISIDGMSLTVGLAAESGSKIRFGIYLSNGLDGYPGDLLVDSGDVAIDSTGLKTGSFSPVNVPVGIVWIGMMPLIVGTTNPQFHGVTAGPGAAFGRPIAFPSITPGTNNWGNLVFWKFSLGGITSLPSTFPAGGVWAGSNASPSPLLIGIIIT